MSVLAAYPDVLLATLPSHEKRVLCVSKTVFKTIFSFFFPPQSFVTIHCLLCLNLLKRHSVHTQTLLNLSLSSPIFKKRYGFCFLLSVFLISCPISLGLCFFFGDLVLYLILEYRYSFSVDYNVYSVDSVVFHPAKHPHWDFCLAHPHIVILKTLFP